MFDTSEGAWCLPCNKSLRLYSWFSNYVFCELGIENKMASVHLALELRCLQCRLSRIFCKPVIIRTLVNTHEFICSQVASYEFTTLTCIPGVITYRGAKIQVISLFSYVLMLHPFSIYGFLSFSNWFVRLECEINISIFINWAYNLCVYRVEIS